MKNKNLLFKLGLMTFVICWFFISFASAGIKFNLTWLQQIFALTEKEVTDNMMYVHFADNWNDFWWFLYFSNTWYSYEEPWDWELYYLNTEWDGGNIYECKTQVKWFYYNAERWDRLWPLDPETWSGVEGMNLTTSWGIFTSCAKSWYNNALNECLSKCSGESDCGTGYNECINNARADYSADNYWYYWSLEQKYSWETYNLIVWVKYNTWEDWDFISIKTGSSFSQSFVRIGNKFPVWFIYDKNGWVGLAWCRFSWESLDDLSMKTLVGRMNNPNPLFNGLFDLFSIFWGKLVYVGGDLTINCENISLADTLLKIVVEWLLWLDNWWSWGGVEDKLVSFGNSSDKKMQYFTTKTVSNSTMMNYARKRAESLCRWKWQSTTSPTVSLDDKIVCLEGSIDVDASNGALSWKVLIVKWWANVKIKPSIDKVYDIFVDGGNLLIEEDENTKKYTIDEDWFYNTTYEINYGIGEVYKSFIEESDDDTPWIVGQQILNCVSSSTAPCDYKGNLLNFVTPLGSIPSNGGDFPLFMFLASSKDNVASVIRWNFIVNWNIRSANEENKLGNKYFVYGKLTSNDTFENLEKEFLWRCNGWLSTKSELHGSDLCLKNIWTYNDIPNPYWNAFLVIIDRDYGSPLLKS